MQSFSKQNHMEVIMFEDQKPLLEGLGVMIMMFNATFNDISVISWRSVLLVEETGVPE